MSDAADEVPKRIRVFENGCWNKRPGSSMRWPEREYQYLLESHSDDVAKARIEELEADLEAAEQRGYANAMEAERKLHEDRIEALIAERDTAKEYAGEVRKREMAAENARVNVTDKLSKAMLALEEIAGNGSAAGRNPQLMADKARATLAELTGGKDD